MTIGEKGTEGNPYTISEYEEMAEAGTWNGGYITDENGMAVYMMAELVVEASGSGSGSGSGSDSGCDSGSQFEFSSGSVHWHTPDDDDDDDGNENPGGTIILGNDDDENQGGTGGGGGGYHGGQNNNPYNEPNVTLLNKVDNGPCVKIHAIRYVKGGLSTISAFKAAPYDSNGNIISSKTVSGYFLEPKINKEIEKNEGSNAAIPLGEYTIIRKVAGQKYDWYLKDVYNRRGIAIHAGNKYDETKGCLLPGTSVNYGQTCSVDGSRFKLDQLINLFVQYGANNISILIE